MITLDTNVMSSVMNDTPDEAVVYWLDRQPRLSLWITSITVLEIRFGLAIMAAGRRRSRLNEAFEIAVNEKLDRRIISFDEVSAEAAAALMAIRQQRGRSGELRDALIAGIALAHRATLATRNTRHFNDLSIPIVNPWESDV